jgi:hypothetical protein
MTKFQIDNIYKIFPSDTQIKEIMSTPAPTPTAALGAVNGHVSYNPYNYTPSAPANITFASTLEYVLTMAPQTNY